MKKFILALAMALCFSTPAPAQMMVGKLGHMDVVLTSKVCSNKAVLELSNMYAAMGAPKVVHAGTVKEDGKTMNLCYVRIDRKTVFVIDESGGIGELDVSKFKESI